MKRMTYNRSLAGLMMVAILTLIPVASQADIVLDFSSLEGAKVHFDGNGNFEFTPGSADQFEITASDGDGNSVGDTGFMSGLFTIGNITTDERGFQTAPVTGSGVLTIHDGLHYDLTATLTWNAIARMGAGGEMNFDGGINLTGIQYKGTKSDYQALSSPGVGIEVLTFQFATAGTLDYVKAHVADASSFSGSITAVPETTTFIAGAGALGLLLLGMGSKSRRSGVLGIGK